jgi:hypothetical protein
MEKQSYQIHIKTYNGVEKEMVGLLLHRFMSNKEAMDNKVCMVFTVNEKYRYVVNVRDYRKSLCITISKINNHGK